MARTEDKDLIAFWSEVREAIRSFLESNRRSGSESNGFTTQADLAQAIGLSPTRLANFLCAANGESINGFSFARACSLGIRFQCNEARIGRIDSQREPADQTPPQAEQLLLEFSEDFQIEQVASPLTIKLRRGPTSADATSRTLRLSIG
jgi:hypothetical protein